jgi:cation transport ATPase
MGTGTDVAMESAGVTLVLEIERLQAAGAIVAMAGDGVNEGLTSP